MTSKELNLQLQNIKSAQEVTSTYQQVAAMRMRKIKDTVIQNRDFYNSLSEVYAETHNYYLKFVTTNTRVPKSGGHRQTNGKTVAVLLTANTGLYGNVIKDVYNLFLKEQQNAGNDAVIVGRLGRNWVQPPYSYKNVKYFDLNDGTDFIDAGIKQVFDYVSKYATVLVYHGIFKNVTQQPAQVTKVTQQLTSNRSSLEGGSNEPLSFLFEPTIDKVLEVFEKQLIYSIFDQSFYESSLAKFGSRMMSLDIASQNASKALGKLELSLIKMKHRKQNKKQIETTSGIFLGVNS